jgi:hypothetical protein
MIPTAMVDHYSKHITRQDELLCALKKEEPVLPDCGRSVRNAPEHNVQLSSRTNCAAASFLGFALLGRKGTDSRERILVGLIVCSSVDQ